MLSRFCEAGSQREVHTVTVSPEKLQLRGHTSDDHDDSVQHVLQYEVQVHDEQVHRVGEPMHTHHGSKAVLLLVYQLDHRLRDQRCSCRYPQVQILHICCY